MNTNWLVLAIVLAIIAVIFFLISVRKNASSPQPEQPRTDPLQFFDGTRDFSPQVLGPGAIISYRGIDYVCRGMITLRQGQYLWHEYLLDGGNGSEYLSVDYDEGQLKLSWWISRPDLDIEPAHEISVDGVRYIKTESGVGEFSSEGTTGVPDNGRFSYWDLAEAGGNRLLGLETFGLGAAPEASLGWRVTPAELSVYPAPKVNDY